MELIPYTSREGREIVLYVISSRDPISHSPYLPVTHPRPSKLRPNLPSFNKNCFRLFAPTSHIKCMPWLTRIVVFSSQEAS